MVRFADVWKSASLAAVLLVSTMLYAEQAQAQHQAHQHGNAASAKRNELGTSAAADAKGQLWAVSKEVAEDGKSYLVLRNSADAGASWSVPQRIIQEPVAARGDERPKIAFGPKGELYLLYTRPQPGSKNPHIGDIRFLKSEDGGNTFSPPLTVHANREMIVHSFGSLVVDGRGNIYAAWIDNRDRDAAKTRQQAYTGNAIYYAVSTDGGATFKGDYKIADHTCECCRISLSLNAQGRPVAMWRHVFAPNIRDHALAELTPAGKPGQVVRATFDDWKVDACPHHGPSLAYGTDGIRHQVWFNGKEGDDGGVKYAAVRANAKPVKPVSIGSAQAAHADVLVRGKHVVIAWKDFDGQSTIVRGRVSTDNGKSWTDKEFAATAGDADKPYLIDTPSGIMLIWNTVNEGLRAVRTLEETS